MTENPYLFVFILLLLGGVGVPMPEEIPLFYAGIFASKPDVSLWIMLAVGYAGVMIGDQIMYAFGYSFGNRLLDRGTRSRFLPFITEEKVLEVREGLRKRRLLYLFIGRHLFFLRSVTFIVAGAVRIPFKEFLIADGFAALCSVTVFVLLGYALGSSVSTEWVESMTRRANVVVVAAILIGFVGYRLFERSRGSGGAEESTGAGHHEAQGNGR